jgi:hypothetical protein
MSPLKKFEEERRRLRELGMSEYESKVRRGVGKEEALINAVAAIVAASQFPKVVD